MAVVPLDVLRHLPLLAACIWFGLALMQVYRDRTHTWTETFFLFACFFAGLYAFSDWLFFNSTNDVGALGAARLGLTSVILTELFFLLFTVVYVARMRRAYWLIAGASIPLLLYVWTATVEGVIRPSVEGLYLPVLNPVAFLVLLLYVIACGGVGVVNLYRVYRIVREQSRGLARRAAGLVITFVTVLFLGMGTNGYLGVTQNTQVPPLFSTLLILVGFMTAYTLYPGGRERISAAIRKFRARRYQIEGVSLVYNDGTLIASRGREGAAGLDRDLFSATLDVIQNFMRTSFPFLRGTSLRTIEHGSYRILIERGKWCYLTVVLSGEENDLLRRQMRDLLREFEQTNADILRRWRGIPADAPGAEGMLRSLFEPADLFGPATPQ
ncbi:MAG TPA: hypothetical protein VI915_02720 [Thermoplasmata archaeon]|nr:hypothetical protein [Thermoplasmata archaeon]